MALAGEREDQRQAHLRRHPGHRHVGADGRPLHFQVRSGTRGWGAFWGQAGPLKHTQFHCPCNLATKKQNSQ